MELGRSAPMLTSASPGRGGGDGAGAGRAQPATGSSTTIAKFCSTGAYFAMISGPYGIRDAKKYFDDIPDVKVEPATGWLAKPQH